MTSAALVVAEARNWIGRPYLHQGRTWDGVDCIGLVIAVCSRLALLAPDFRTGAYGRVPANGMLRSRVSEHCEIARAPAPGLLAIIRWTREASHVAILTGETMIHSYQHVGRVVEHGYRRRWLRMTDSLWRLPGVDY